tara:strand:+ start:809 stop:1054 length:246 start_codon:yes stop_codon:yes gene_type:complete
MKYLLAALLAVGLIGGSQVATYAKADPKQSILGTNEGGVIRIGERLGETGVSADSTDGKKVTVTPFEERMAKGDKNETSTK